MCPVCTVTVIAGLGLSRFLGIDDLITSLWIGGFILSFSFITIDWIKKKWPSSPLGIGIYWKFVLIGIIYIFVLVPLILSRTIGIIRNTVWGMDKIVFGIIVGSLVFLIGIWADKKVRGIKGKQLFIYQKVAFPVLMLVISSLFFYLITKSH